MGSKIDESNEIVGTENAIPDECVDRQTCGNTDTTTAKISRKRGRKPSGEHATGGTSEKTIVPEMVVLETPDEKPKKVRKSRKNKSIVEMESQIALIIGTISGIIATREKWEHWLLSESEIQNIAKPMAEILSEKELFSKISENSSEIALMVACMSALVPRTMISVSNMQKSKTGGKNDGKHDGTNSSIPNPNVDGVNRKNEKSTSTGRTVDFIDPDVFGAGIIT